MYLSKSSQKTNVGRKERTAETKIIDLLTSLYSGPRVILREIFFNLFLQI